MATTATVPGPLSLGGSGKNDISQEYRPLQLGEIPTHTPNQIDELSVQEVAKRLRECKKSGSSVPGDLVPSLYGLYSQELVIPVTNIFNGIISSKKWPTQWKTEFVTIIPKIPSPKNLQNAGIFLAPIYCLKCLKELSWKWPDKR